MVCFRTRASLAIAVVMVVMVVAGPSVAEKRTTG